MKNLSQPVTHTPLRERCPWLRQEFIIVALLLATPSAMSLPAADAPLRVTVKPAPPFVIAGSKSQPTGIAIELWRAMAESLTLSYRFVEVDSVPQMIDGVAQERYDIGLGAISITAERLEKVNFTQPYFHSGLGIAVPSHPQSSWMDLLHNVLSPDFLKAIAGLVTLLLIVGLSLWWFERRRNPAMFSNNTKGIGNAFWWAAVTMTTVGYGDKVPVTLGGRLVATVWMFAAIIVISGFTAAIATSLTLSGLQGDIQGPKDLQRVTVATVAGSSSEAYLHAAAIRTKAFDNLEQAMASVADG